MKFSLVLLVIKRNELIQTKVSGKKASKSFYGTSLLDISACTNNDNFVK